MKNPTNISPADGAEPTLDALLGGRVRLLQPRGGLRAAIDPVLLAASVPARTGDVILEAGCGTGAASLCLAARVAGIRIVGLDVQSDLIALACQSAALNDMSDRVSFRDGDLLTPPAEIVSGHFDHVMANPPFMRAGSGRVPPDPSKALASIEGPADLAAWVAFCAGAVRAGGSVTFIHRADRAAELTALFLAAGLNAIVLPLGPKRVLVQGNKTAQGPVQYAPALMLHQADGSFTPELDTILRNAGVLSLRR
jgi:tRNA1(Val) A37 N6-methylase TrmN6